MPPRKERSTKAKTAANVGYEVQLWQMADALRGSLDAAEYKHVVLGLIFLKCISGAFEEHHARLLAEEAKGADPEDADEWRFSRPRHLRLADTDSFDQPTPKLAISRRLNLQSAGSSPQSVIGKDVCWPTASSPAGIQRR